MRTEILVYLRNEGYKRRKNESDTFNLAPFLEKTFPGADPKAVKRLLTQMNEENVLNVSGDYTSLGASFAGVIKKVSDVTIHAQLTDSGRAEISSVAAPVQRPVVIPQILKELVVEKEAVDPAKEEALKAISAHVLAPEEKPAEEEIPAVEGETPSSAKEAEK